MTRLRRLLATSPWAATLAALVAVLPRVGRAESEDTHAIDLASIAVDEGGAHAALANGDRAELTLNPALQRAAERLLQRARPIEGAVTLIDVKSGRLLVLAELRRPHAAAGSVLTLAKEPAASVFKLVTTTALLEGGEVGLDTKICTAGGNHSIERRHLDAPRRGRALCAPFGLALGHSRNAAYAQLATHHLTRETLIDIGRRYGFNRRVPSEIAATMGTLEVPYGDLDFARTAAGFRGSTLSPLGAAELAYTIASGGRAIHVHVVARAPDFELPEAREIAGRVTDAWTAHRLTKMMEVTTSEGTSAEVFNDPASGKAYLPGIRVAGKTGTLQSDTREPTTSWFTGFAPSRKPEVVVSVLLVNGSVWRNKANEVARDLLRVHFRAQGRSNVSDPFSP